MNDTRASFVNSSGNVEHKDNHYGQRGGNYPKNIVKKNVVLVMDVLDTSPGIVITGTVCGFPAGGRITRSRGQRQLLLKDRGQQTTWSVEVMDQPRQRDGRQPAQTGERAHQLLQRITEDLEMRIRIGTSRQVRHVHGTDRGAIAFNCAGSQSMYRRSRVKFITITVNVIVYSTWEIR